MLLAGIVKAFFAPESGIIAPASFKSEHPDHESPSGE